MSSVEHAPLLRVSAIHSFVDSSFFQRLSELKLDQFKLDVSTKQILGAVHFRSLNNTQSPIMNLSVNSFSTSHEYSQSLPKDSSFFMTGVLTNVNTIEDFKKTDKPQFLRDGGMKIYDAILTKQVLQEPAILTGFSLLSFSDLKKYRFYYWCAFPVLQSDWCVDGADVISEETTQIVHDWIEDGDIDLKDKQFFLLQNGKAHCLSELFELDSDQLEFVFVDSCWIESSPSACLKNFLAMLAIYGFTQVNVTVFRFNNRSKRMNLSYKGQPITEVPKIIGWERTNQGKLGPKLADLGSLIDPTQLADQAVDLNLKLMKWRIAPALDLDKIKETKCLLLGAGTLGSYVSRALLGWGIRNVTFVDNGKVSFSNPVRQPLFTFEDCLDGGQYKALKAAETLKQIFPLVNSVGYNLEVPMAGHPVTNEDSQRKDYELLVKLVKEHDAIFLLMDSRETRWLPTILGNVHQKIVINAALGFDSYLVMRHGNIKDVGDSKTDRLGCYFCNDVFAPSDSLTDRTLDQMCTVTRPGVALMASALAVELLVSITQHPEKQFAPASTSNDTTVLGSLPHQIRGFLHNFENIKLSAPNYQYCSACSNPVLDRYEQEGWEFIKKCLENPKYIEDVSGLSEVQRRAEEAVLELDADFTDEDEFM